MRRMHIGLEVKDLDASIRFYSGLFGSPPTHRETDYAKWMLEDPKVNFAIQTRGCEAPGSLHFGIQVENDAELSETSQRLRAAGEDVMDEPGAVCCYHKADKIWVRDPDQHRWETFLTHGRVPVYGEDLGLSLEEPTQEEATT